jgi:Flp pilus assembly protein TadG
MSFAVREKRGNRQLTRRRVRKADQDGQAMVETALIIMVVLLLMMGIIEFGFLFFAYVRVSNSAREGARAGSLWLVDREADAGYYTPTLCDAVRTAVKSEFDQVADSEITVAVVGQDPVICSPESVTPEAGQPITVTVTYDFELPVVTSLPIIGDLIPSPYPVSRAVAMRFQ